MAIKLAILATVLIVMISLLVPVSERHVVFTFVADDCFRREGIEQEPLDVTICSKGRPPRFGIQWEPHPLAESYRVSGKIDYWFAACDEDPPWGPTESVEVTETLSAQSTRYVFPAAKEQKTTTVNSYEMRVEAVDAHGETIASDGLIMIGEIPFGCAAQRK